MRSISAVSPCVSTRTRITVAKDEYVGILAGLATSRDLGDVHNRIAFGDKPVELHRR